MKYKLKKKIINSFHVCGMQQLSIIKFTIFVRGRENIEIEGENSIQHLNNIATAVLKK